LENFTKTYKPKILEDYICEEDLKDKIQKYIDNDMRKPIILHGPAGTGKTTLAEVVGAELNGNVHSLNASIDNGIDVVRSMIVPWTKQSSFGGGVNVIILDEAERFSQQAQDALKRTIDDSSGFCIFIFCTNNINKIIKPLQSRAEQTTYKLGYTSNDILMGIVTSIVNNSDIELDVKDAYDIVRAAAGEPRAVVNALQAFVVDTFTAPTNKRTDFEKIFTDLAFDTPILEILPLLTEDDLTELGKYVLEELEYSAQTVLDIANCDRAMQNSVNKDIHLIALLLKFKEVC